MSRSRFRIFFLILLSLNLVVLDIFVFFRTSSLFRSFLSPLSNASYIAEIKKSSLDLCPKSCLSKIDELSSSLPAATPSAIVPSSSPVVPRVNAPREVFISFGSGTGSSDDWADVPGLQVTIDTQQYPGIKTSYFEASVYVPGANQIVSVRLYDITDKHLVWFSELTFNNAGTAQTQTSPVINLDPGNKTYVVQMKAQLKFSTNITSSRVRILTN